MIAIRGIRSQIAVELIKLLPPGEEVHEIYRGDSGRESGADRFVFLQGLIRTRQLIDQSPADREESFSVNAAEVMSACDRLIEAVPHARIVVLGSESGFAGSFDGVYAAAKAALHRYVETKQLKASGQQLVCIAPGIIGDAGMTLRRADAHNLVARQSAHRKRRFLESVEVARLIHFLLYVDQGYLSGIVIRMNGGAHTC